MGALPLHHYTRYGFNSVLVVAHLPRCWYHIFVYDLAIRGGPDVSNPSCHGWNGYDMIMLTNIGQRLSLVQFYTTRKRSRVVSTLIPRNVRSRRRDHLAVDTNPG